MTLNNFILTIKNKILSSTVFVFTILFSFCNTNSAFSQFEGGIGDGYSSTSATNVTEVSEFLKENFNISPNPAAPGGVVGFKYNGETPPELIIIYSVNNVIFKQLVPETLSKWSFFFAPPAKGIYFVEIRYKDEKKIVKLVVTS